MVHAAPDEALARRFGAYLERNCAVEVDYRDSRQTPHRLTIPF